MRPNFIRFLLFFVLMIMAFTQQAQVLPSFGNSRTGTTGFQFLKIYPDARSSGMAGSVVSFTNDLSSVYWNPAGLTFLDSNRLHFQFGHTAYFAGTSLNYAAASFTHNYLNFWAFHAISFSTPDMPVTTEFNPEGNGLNYKAGDFLASLSFAKILSENFSFGLNAKFIMEDIAGIKTYNGLFDIGFVYNIGFSRKTRFAVSISNFGFNVSPKGKVVVSTLNGDKILENFENIAVPAIFRMGIATQVWQKGPHSLSACTQLTHPTDNNETASVGVEYVYRKFLKIRSGYEFGSDLQSLPTAGIGIFLPRYFGNMSVDYGFNARDYFGNTHRITVGFSLK